MEARVRLSDVAKAAGVSAATVSRVLRRPELVSPGVRERILGVIEELGYFANPAARALASARTNVIGILIPSLTNNVFADVLRGIYSVAQDSPYDLQFANTRYSNLEEENLLRVFLSQKPAGLIVTGTDQSPASRTLLKQASCPVVQIMETGDDPVDMMVGFSHVRSAHAATAHLVGQGYRSIAFLGARMDPRTRRRMQGYSRALEEAGLFDERLIVTTPRSSTVTLGCELLGLLLEKELNADAVFCNNDDLALGVLFECQRRRIAVPSQMGICGFNDLEMMAVANPPVSSIRTFRQEMGEQAIRMLIDRIEGRAVTTPLLDLGFELMVRQSSQRQLPPL
ncbi:LacI family DNA-binding transcriptional regulator [Aquamicrobium defluvii]|uniref:Transcriptional regulator n=1 Tax=Aquamicrobium defluvii TaxID=69279 RepID=A0A011URZ1_9HYPH|nr:LacI family DNA-binding transcriptional regulator [Aquamicrobium defluvii]EXL08643.1 transcriptional regulator [Aquamicrobium defluvii]EZQ14845.1 transcriptional regulator [Halopseudomonas bauzanensis]TDR37545.1 LacI family transcriptional regulator [Aquamicrobium defluvii]